MLELVFVIVVIGILAAAIIPRMQRENTAEATLKLLSDLRYTQHLALVDDKYDATATWFQNRWKIRFDGGSYRIESRDNGAVRYAKDPETKKDIQVDLTDLYGVTLSLAGGCANSSVIAFDHLGRPMIGDVSTDILPYPAGKLLTANCTITISSAEGDSNTITIHPETGYAQGL